MWRDPRLHAIADAAHALDALRAAWLNPPHAPEAELKQRTLTTLYNQRPVWLAQAHAALDRAVWAAYGWEEAPEATSDEAILERLLALNGARASGSGVVVAGGDDRAGGMVRSSTGIEDSALPA